MTMASEQIGEFVVDGAVIPIELNVKAGRLDLRIGDQVAFIALRVSGSVLALIHTEVPAALQGKHIAEALARMALEYARAHGMTVKPFCPFIAHYIRRHLEFQDLVDPTFSNSRGVPT